MKTKRNILIAFILNTAFSIFELIGGAITGSVAITSDALHDMSDALSIAISYFLERKSMKKPNEQHTYGYTRYSVMGGFITTMILLVGSFIVIYHSVIRLIAPVMINYNKMIVFAIVGVIVNFLAAFFTREGHSLNQKAVNLHMLEDVLAWLVVLLGAIIMRFTQFSILDPLLSIGVALFIGINAIKNLKEIADIFLEKTPKEIHIEELKTHMKEISGVTDVHHIHIWSMDGINHYATMHVTTDHDAVEIKQRIREELNAHHIHHVTIELETSQESCTQAHCLPPAKIQHPHHHHH